jgi:hypothetical protein
MRMREEKYLQGWVRYGMQGRQGSPRRLSEQ